jgi:NADP-dependent 3-hydroxy acid dehydrogenase YdfG
MSVENKVVIVTGASSGIGEATVKMLVNQGAKVVFGARRLEKLEAIANQLPTEQIAYQTVDVTDHQQVQDLVDLAVKKFGQVDAFFNNAGIMPIAPLADDHRDEWQQMLDINIMGVLNGISAVLPVMHKQGHGHILVTSSLAGYQAFPDFAVYSGTKFAVRAILDSLRQEENKNHIKTTVIAPGAVKTELYRSISDPKVAQGLIEDWNKSDDSALIPDDIASAVVYAIGTPQRVTVDEIRVRPSSR